MSDGSDLTHRPFPILRLKLSALLENQGDTVANIMLNFRRGVNGTQRTVVFLRVLSYLQRRKTWL